MITWGISATSHNAALAVFEDSELLFASDSERFSKIKNDPKIQELHTLQNLAKEFNMDNVEKIDMLTVDELKNLIKNKGKGNILKALANKD